MAGLERMTAKQRGATMRWFDLMMQNQEDLAAIMTAEQGKPLAEHAGRSPTSSRRVVCRGR